MQCLVYLVTIAVPAVGQFAQVIATEWLFARALHLGTPNASFTAFAVSAAAFVGVLAGQDLVYSARSALHVMLNNGLQQVFTEAYLDGCGGSRFEAYLYPRFHDLLRRGLDVLRANASDNFIRNSTTIPRYALQCAGVVGALCVFNWVVAAGACASVVPVLVELVRHGGRARRLQVGETRDIRACEYVKGLVSSPDTALDLRVSGLDSLLLRRFADRTASLAQTRARFERDAFARRLAVAVPSEGALGVAFGLGWALWLTLSHRTTVSVFAATVVALLSLQVLFRVLLLHIGLVQRDSGALGDLFRVVDHGLRERRTTGRAFPVPMREGIRFEHVAYRYPGSSGWAIQDINITFRPGECVAVVGENGSGKSTLVGCLLGLYSPTNGQILVDGIPIGEFGADELGAHMSACMQAFGCYELRARDNVGFGQLDLLNHDDALMSALDKVGGGPLLRIWPMCWDTWLDAASAHGVDLSRGQWQRLALARAAIRRSQVVVLDEPTSALDPERERELFDRFVQVSHGRVGLVVTHRLGWARFAGWIVVMEGGRIVEVGTHNELLRLGGVYSRLWERQAGLFVSDGAR
jgi:ATP-binding cassette subfamily B protein